MNLHPYPRRQQRCMKSPKVAQASIEHALDTLELAALGNGGLATPAQQSYAMGYAAATLRQALVYRRVLRRRRAR